MSVSGEAVTLFFTLKFHQNHIILSSTLANQGKWSKWIKLNCQAMTQQLQLDSQWFWNHAPSALAKQLLQLCYIYITKVKRISHTLQWIVRYFITFSSSFIDNMGVTSKRSYLFFCFFTLFASFLWADNLMTGTIIKRWLGDVYFTLVLRP